MWPSSKRALEEAEVEARRLGEQQAHDGRRAYPAR